MDSPRWRTALHGVHKQDNFRFFKGIKQIQAAARQFQEFRSAITTSLEAADDFEPHIVIRGKGATTADYQQAR